eukprot:1161693-Pelagomonas_calceolata.AAC.1
MAPSQTLLAAVPRMWFAIPRSDAGAAARLQNQAQAPMYPMIHAAGQVLGQGPLLASAADFHAAPAAAAGVIWHAHLAASAVWAVLVAHKAPGAEHLAGALLAAFAAEQRGPAPPLQGWACKREAARGVHR